MQLRYKFELRCQLDRLRHSLDSVKILFRLGVGGKIIPRIRLALAKDLVEVEAELGNWLLSKPNVTQLNSTQPKATVKATLLG